MPQTHCRSTLIASLRMRRRMWPRSHQLPSPRRSRRNYQGSVNKPPSLPARQARRIRRPGRAHPQSHHLQLRGNRHRTRWVHNQGQPEHPHNLRSHQHPPHRLHHKLLRRLRNQRSPRIRFPPPPRSARCRRRPPVHQLRVLLHRRIRLPRLLPPQHRVLQPSNPDQARPLRRQGYALCRRCLVRLAATQSR